MNGTLLYVWCVNINIDLINIIYSCSLVWIFSSLSFSVSNLYSFIWGLMFSIFIKLSFSYSFVNTLSLIWSKTYHVPILHELSWPSCTLLLLMKGQKCSAFILIPYWFNCWIFFSWPASVKLLYVAPANNLNVLFCFSVCINCCLWSDLSFSAAAIFGQSLAKWLHSQHLKHRILFLFALAFDHP